MNEVEIMCQCPGKCGNSIKVSQKILEREAEYEGLIISLVCPNIDLNTQSVLGMTNAYAVILKLEEEN